MIRRIFSIFNSSHYTFDGKDHDERVILLLRRHPFTILAPFLLFALGCVVPVALYFNLETYLVAHGWREIFLFVSMVWFMMVWVSLFYTLTMFTLNVMIVTDKRIIESIQNGFFDRKVTELHTSRVQDVSTHVSGVIETFLTFGDIVVQTAGSEKQFTFRNIPHPERVKDTIMQIVGSRHDGVLPI